jgi:hypothetical protein
MSPDPFDFPDFYVEYWAMHDTDTLPANGGVGSRAERISYGLRPPLELIDFRKG